ncbi:MAG: hypothetical protein NZ841_05585 [Dictyoglomus sp.]|nr:hypothetical protein [Dictyoglomus sp.]MCX7942512.1 hypothetical protein [Dictyoglomaceae bacterium]MDW8188750.1 hypothetical protein [Dictyoglomus sp.]
MNEIIFKYLGWLRENNQYRDIFVRTKIRLIRNVADFPFPKQANNIKKKVFLNRIEWLLKNSDVFDGFNLISFDKTSSKIKYLFLEKGFLNKDLKEDGRGILVNKKGDLSILINEDDHFQLQKLSSGFEFETSFNQLFELEDKLSEYFNFAFDSQIGYLTSYLENLGFGIRINFWVHLPGLFQEDEISKLVKSFRSSRVQVKEVYKEEDYPIGNVFEITINEGLSTKERLTSKVNKIVEKLVTKEKEARNNLLRERKIIIEDTVYKSLGLINYSKLLSFRGAWELLFNLRLGSSLNIISIPLKLIDVLLIFIQPNHIQIRYDKELSSPEMEILRANLLRDVFKSYKIS